MRKPLTLAMFVLILSALACNAPQPGGTAIFPTATPATAGPVTVEAPPTPMIMCTPPLCAANEVYHCPGECPGGCGTGCATPTPQTALPSAPTIFSFSADRMAIVQEESVVLTWQASGGSEASICWVTREAILTCVQDPLNPDGGTVTITPSGPGRPGATEIALTVTNSAGSAEASVEVTIECAEDPLPELEDQQMYGNCPYGTMVGTAAYQPFQNGTMLWLQGNGTIYVLYANDQYETYADTFREGDPESDPALVTPAGLYQPVRGFGLVWRTNERVRDGLGWALAPEAGFQGWSQSYSGVGMHTSGTFIRSLDGTIYVLSHFGAVWSVFRP